MEFAEWVVSGLDQLRSGQLPSGQGLYEAVSAALDGDSALDRYMNGGDDAARAELVQALAQALAADPALEQQLRQAAEAAQNAQGAQGTQSPQNTEETQSAPIPPDLQAAGTGAPASTSFFKTTNGMLVILGAAVVVLGGGIGLGVGLSGDGGGHLGSALKGTWHCSGKGNGPDESGNAVMTIGDGTWDIGGTGGTFKQDGSRITLTERDEPGHPVVISGAPTGTGSVDTQLKSDQNSRFAVHLKGRISSSSIHLVVSQESESVAIDCTK
ncbi:MAG: hypothetical protein HOV83_03390 [Catenulispora sp.]|nr:hypothetical protein [Catenulispora sp.]